MGVQEGSGVSGDEGDGGSRRQWCEWGFKKAVRGGWGFKKAVV